MGRRTPLNFWEKGRPIIKSGKEEHFTRLGDSLFTHPAFLELTYTERLLYIYMCRASAGKIEFNFNHSFYTSLGVTKATFQRAVNTLIEKKFIRKVLQGKNVRKSNVYRFTNEWKNYE